MPKRTDIHKILIIGSGPIVIGQACEFDYSGTQAVKALKEEGYQVVLVNSNPATIMTDPELAHRTYIEPITPKFVRKIIERERPDALLSTMGGQTGLNVAVALAEDGTLNSYGVELIGAKLEAIHRAEDRELFKKTIESIGLEMPRGGFAHSKEEAFEIAKMLDFPIIIRPSFTLGGTGGSIVYNRVEFEKQIEWGLQNSPIREILVEESIIGWKEYELEVMRDLNDNVVIICSIENFDPMGIHTGDSVTVAPAQTLTDREYQKLRDASIKIIRAVGVETGGSNIQFGMDPKTGRLLVIEMNPRVSRSSALASKATGFPIAKIAAKLAVGLTLDEIPNDITKKTPAAFEPTLDYVVVKIPRWNFDKFPTANAKLGTQMKSVGEAMSIGRTFKEALGKAVQSLDISRFGLGLDDSTNEARIQKYRQKNFHEKLIECLKHPNDLRLFYLREAMLSNFSIEEIYRITGIDPWFLYQFKEIVDLEPEILQLKGKADSISADSLRYFKKMGYSDIQLAVSWRMTEEEIRALRKKLGVETSFKSVDTCAAEFEAETPYFYSTFDRENEAFPSSKSKIMILGSGPNRIGQGIEFDYCSVHAVFALQEEGYETIMVNCNPETVSTDYDTADKLYFEPITYEKIMNIIDVEHPDGVIVQFGGQAPLNLALRLEEAGVKILGTSPKNIDLAEDREKFGTFLNSLGLRQPQNGFAHSTNEALEIARRIGFPILIRPSYVLGGRAMEIVYDEESLQSYMDRAIDVSEEHPVLIDQFLEDAFEGDVEAISDGKEVIVAGVMQHIEEAGIHSGDSSCVMPPFMITPKQVEIIKKQTRKIAKALNVVGLVNLQFAIKDGVIYILEVNPRASRTVPFVSKAKGIPLAKIAAKLMVGKTLEELGITQDPVIHYNAVKSVVFPFQKFPGTKTYLGPEMRSTGEVMGLGDNFGLAFAKAHLSTGLRLPLKGTVFISVNDNDKAKVISIAKSLADLGFNLVATRGTSAALEKAGLRVKMIFKVNEGRPNVVDHVINGDIQMMINTPLGKASRYDEYAMNRIGIERNIPNFTTLSAATAAVEAIKALRVNDLQVKSLQEYHRDVIRNS